jgi:hypothetical protein
VWYTNRHNRSDRAQLQFIHGIAVDSAGSLYIAELDCRVRRVSDGIITTVAGNGTCGYAGDGGPAKDAELDGPVAVATDAAGDLYISDDNNCRVRLVRGATITTVAGDGTCHFRGDGGPATEAGIEPAGVAVASDGTLYIVDTPNGRKQHAPYGACRVRAVRRGTITTAAGTSCMSFGGDGGPAVEASMELPVAIAIGVPDDVVIGDTGNCRVREVHNGIILIVAGRGPDADRGCRYSGDGGPATGAGLSPTGLAVDGVGNLYIGDAANCQVRKVASGLITTVAGTGHCPS